MSEKGSKKDKTDKTHEKFPYINRELSWLDFNERVLQEAYRKENPVLDRLKFLAITASNMDEFYMVRVASVREQIRLGYKVVDATGMTVSEQYEKIMEKCHEFAKKQYTCLHRSIMPVLKKHNINVLRPEELNDDQKVFVAKYFENVFYPILTPMAVDSSRPFPFLSNRSLNIAVRLKKSGKTFFGVVQVPSIVPRLIEIPCENGKTFILSENVIQIHMQKLFDGYNIKAVCPFRLTRNSDLHIDEHADDILVEVQKSILKRKKGKPIRIEIPKNSDEETRKFLVDELKVKKEEIFECPGALDLTVWMKLSNLPGYDHLRLPPIVGVVAKDFRNCTDIFQAIREGDKMIHHPYESFDTVTNFLNCAADDPNVLAIKQTLYRVSGNSPIVAALMRAAEKGKQVTVLVELKARFDEENNIQWAKKLEKAGCHVIYGFPELKTHCKMLLVVRRDDDEIRRYLHLGTGNYNDSTAKLYTDIGMFTCRESFGEDATTLFNTLTGYNEEASYQRLIVAPHWLRSFFVEKITNEINNAKKGLPSGITIKVNSLLDEEIVKLLYDASCAGVRIKLVVRGICSIIPGLEGISENISVISIVGQLLEHSRIFKFENAGSPEYYMGSADIMPRNLDRRIEVVFPVLDERLKARAESILQTFLSDTYNAREQLSDGSFAFISKQGKKKINAQEQFAIEARS